MCTYSVTAKEISDEAGNKHTVYGVAAGKMTVDDVFTEKEKAEAFVQLCNKHGLCKMHLLDVISDFIE